MLRPVKIAKPLLLVTTPLGVFGGIYEAYRLAGGLVFLFVALIALIGTAMGTLVFTVRKEKAEAERKAALESQIPAERQPAGVHNTGTPATDD